MNRKQKKNAVGADFGKRLTLTLKEKRISQREAARKVGVPLSVLNGWCAGRVPHDLKQVKRLADELGISFSYLMTGEYEKAQRISELSVGELFESQEFWEGICRVKIEKLVRKKSG